jgi:hypothetical protein
MTTGTDEHGQKNQEAAEASGLATSDYLDRAHRFVPFALERGGTIGGLPGPLFPRV